ncbi:MAG: hypothetical protein KVP17_002444 [Porospora cf. gigantea B]|nr:MAG: hypothetical protein KVP17_002444 [Porospora cf. gigantea B]
MLPLIPGALPEGLLLLMLRDYNQKLDSGTLPSSLRKLILQSFANRGDRLHLPPNLTDLWLPAFTDSDVVWPSLPNLENIALNFWYFVDVRDEGANGAAMYSVRYDVIVKLLLHFAGVKRLCIAGNVMVLPQSTWEDLREALNVLRIVHSPGLRLYTEVKSRELTCPTTNDLGALTTQLLVAEDFERVAGVGAEAYFSDEREF